MNRSGIGPQSLTRGSSNVFQTQQAPSQRTATGTLGSGRLQNGKLGSGSGQNWNFGLGTTPAPGGLPSSQSRHVGLSGFAQAIGGSQSQASLDLSAFPSLPGSSQGQPQQPQQPQLPGSNSPSNWPPANSQMHRFQSSSNQGSIDNPIQPPSHLHSSRQRPSDSDSFPPSHSGQSNESRYAGGPGQSSRQPDTQGSSDGFPPLSLGGSDMASTRRDIGAQSTRANGATNGNNFPYGPPPPTQLDGRSERPEQTFSPMDSSRGAPGMTMSPLDHVDHDSFSRGDQNSGGRMSRASVQSNFSHNQYGSMAVGDQQRPPQRNASQTSQSLDSTGPSSMSESDRWGLPGLSDLLHGRMGKAAQALALGQNLENLGLDVTRPGNDPLCVDWAGPFAEASSAPVRPDFTVPAAYTVTNVPDLSIRLPDLSDDALFMIFYTQTRDVAQHLAAEALYRRDWRWHKKRQQWMMKDKDSPEPVISPDRASERGIYNFMNIGQWDVQKADFVLKYDDLYHPVRD